MDFFTLGPVPIEEGCVQVGEDDYIERAYAECRRYRERLKKRFPENLFGIKQFPHDFGPYLEVVVYFDEHSKESIESAANVEHNLPRLWTDEEEEEYENAVSDR